MSNNCNGRPCPRPKEEGCEKVINKSMEISTPVSIEPEIEVGKIVTTCGRPVIEERDSECGRRRACNFVIRQRIDVEIPISYEVDTDIGDSHVACGQAR